MEDGNPGRVENDRPVEQQGDNLEKGDTHPHPPDHGWQLGSSVCLAPEHCHPRCGISSRWDSTSPFTGPKRAENYTGIHQHTCLLFCARSVIVCPLMNQRGSWNGQLWVLNASEQDTQVVSEICLQTTGQTGFHTA